MSEPVETPRIILAYRALCEDTLHDDRPWHDLRFVALDSETTGLDPRRDRLITIGAIAVVGGDILLGDAFEIMMPVRHNTASVTVHGITVDEARDGVPEPEALEAFLAYLGAGVIVGHHILHDITALNVAYQRHFGFELRNRFLDTMDLTLHLERDGALRQDTRIEGFLARPAMPAVRYRAARPPHGGRRRLHHGAGVSAAAAAGAHGGAETPLVRWPSRSRWRARPVAAELRVEEHRAYHSARFRSSGATGPAACTIDRTTGGGPKQNPSEGRWR